MTLGTRAEGFTDSPGRATQAARVQAAGRTVTSEWALNRPGTRQESLGWSMWAGSCASRCGRSSSGVPKDSRAPAQHPSLPCTTAA